jgi:hypothetical protein
VPLPGDAGYLLHRDSPAWENGDQWFTAKYSVNAAEFDDTLVTESDILMMLIRRYYTLHMKKDKLNPALAVLQSLSRAAGATGHAVAAGYAPC